AHNRRHCSGRAHEPHRLPRAGQYRGVPQRRGSPLGLPPLGSGAQGARLPSDLARGHRCRRQRHVPCGPPAQARWPCCRLRRDPQDAPGALRPGRHAGALRAERSRGPGGRRPRLAGRRRCRWRRSAPQSVALGARPARAAVPPPSGPGRYTTVAHWWGGTFEYNGTTFCNEKRVSFLEYLDLPTRTPVPLELAVCLAEHYDEYRQLMEPKGWTLREAWDVSATPEAYRTYVQQSRGEFSSAKPAYVTLQTAWVSDRTLCYLASGKPAIVQHTGLSRWLPSSEGLFRFRSIDEAAGALAAVEADYDRHCRSARALVAEHCDGQRVVRQVLERALHP